MDYAKTISIVCLSVILTTSVRIMAKEAVKEAREINDEKTTYETKTELQKVIFEPGKHILNKRYEQVNTNEDFLNTIKVPDGYKILGVDYLTEQNCNVWYVNEETVEAIPVYNETDGIYEYSSFGKIVEEEIKETTSLVKTRR